jgi:hypothetical protein
MGLTWLLVFTSPLLVAYETRDSYEIVSKSKSGPQPFSSIFSQLTCVYLIPYQNIDSHGHDSHIGPSNYVDYRV